MAIAGKFFAISDTSSAGEDLIDTIKTATGEDFTTENLPFLVKKLTLIFSGSNRVKINGHGQWSALYLDPTDTRYKLSTDGFDILVSSLVVETGSIPYYLAIVY